MLVFRVAFVFWLQFLVGFGKDLVGIDCDRSTDDFDLIECRPIFEVSADFCFLPSCDLDCPGMCTADTDFLTSPCPIQYS